MINVSLIDNELPDIINFVSLIKLFIMFSFGGFSSLLPYIGYLSIMWVCILIGISGKINISLNIYLNPVHSDQVVFSEENKLPVITLFELTTINNSLKSNDVFASFLFYPYKNTLPKKLCNSETDNIILPAPDILFSGLRAPPQII